MWNSRAAWLSFACVGISADDEALRWTLALLNMPSPLRGSRLTPFSPKNHSNFSLKNLSLIFHHSCRGNLKWHAEAHPWLSLLVEHAWEHAEL
jgi:hypothetical protein